MFQTLRKVGIRGLPAMRSGSSTLGPRRFLNIHEHQSMDLMNEYKVATPASILVRSNKMSMSEATITKAIGKDCVAKAQVLAGGRGKGQFFTPEGEATNMGGVRLCLTPEIRNDTIKKMLGNYLVTKQTDNKGRICNAVLLTERVYARRETYFSIMFDNVSQSPALIASPSGGMDIEAVAAQTPELIFKEPIDINEGVTQEQAERLARNMGYLDEAPMKEAASAITQLYNLFIEKDCTLVEINPMVETHDGKVLCLDAKLNFDDNAEYRQKDIFTLRDPSQEDSRDVAAAQAGLNYIGLDGNIGCLVNGAGLAMATLDVIKLSGGSPANFLDVGGGATVEQVMAAFKILNDDPKVNAVLVNIFGGIMRCDIIATGLLEAVDRLNMKKPVVCRLAGTNVEEAKRLIDESNVDMLIADDLGDAARKACKVPEIMNLAETVNLNVTFSNRE